MRKIIAWKYRHIIKPILFKLDPEFVHNAITSMGVLLGKFSITRNITRRVLNFSHPCLSQNVFGMTFANPVGLSAGFDKNAQLIHVLPSIGFGFGEVGTVTLNPYEGNPKPRLYRLPKSRSIAVYYGLKNIGAEKVIEKLKKITKSASDYRFFISVGKTNSKETVTEDAGIEDYYQCLKKIIAAGVGDIYEINISCPNTFGGEPYINPERLEKLMRKLYTLPIHKPIVVKMPINLSWPDFDQLLQILVAYKVSGVVIGNLNKNHHDPSVLDKIPSGIKGGLSGKPTWELSNNLISKTYEKYHDKLVIIGVGGIFSAEDAYEKIKRGAQLVEIITGMIYQGPQLIGEINQGLSQLLERDGYSNISEAVGSDHLGTQERYGSVNKNG